jgi:hypothetical protein
MTQMIEEVLLTEENGRRRSRAGIPFLVAVEKLSGEKRTGENTIL